MMKTGKILVFWNHDWAQYSSLGVNHVITLFAHESEAVLFKYTCKQSVVNRLSLGMS
jgi:hypothetical protein